MPHVQLPAPPLPKTLYDDLLELPDGRPVATAADWAEKRADIRRRLLAVIGEPPATRPATQERVVGETRCDGYVRKRVVFRVEEDEEAHAWLLVPDRPRGDGAAVLCLQASFRNGADVLVGLDAAREHWLAHDLARRGFTCLAPDHFCAGARFTPAADGRFSSDPFYRRHPRWSAVGKALWDEAAALDVLARVPGVDPRRIGAMGASLGGHGSIFLAAMDERVRAAVSMVGSTAWRADRERMHWCRDWWYCFLPALRDGFLSGRVGTREGVPIDLIEIAALIAPRAFLDIAALDDGNFGAEAGYYVKDGWLRVSDAYAIAGMKDNFACVSHRCGHTLPEWTRQCAFAFLEQHLGA